MVKFAPSTSAKPGYIDQLLHNEIPVFEAWLENTLTFLFFLMFLWFAGV